MKKIYWNEKERQIVTKNGECIWYKDQQEELTDRVYVLEKQLQCAAKGHKMVYETTTSTNGFIFECAVCDFEITKTKEELTATEKEALKKLKLL